MTAMATSFSRALVELHRSYRGFPAGRRLHTLARFLTCPFLPVANAVPAGARVLDIGAGDGIFARLAAAHGAREVIALEPDLRKCLPRLRHAAVRVVAGFDDAVGGQFDVVTMIDVLYKVPLREWDGLFARVRDRLVPGGLFLLKELDPEHRWKAVWNRAQESLANALDLTLGRSFSYEAGPALRARLERAGLDRFEVHYIGRWYPHAHVLYSARRTLN
jgi:2-polyprenyl-3-methyl-5-hydroxy-6-metoxy-1,4-benzoquinol methylase